MCVVPCPAYINPPHLNAANVAVSCVMKTTGNVNSRATEDVPSWNLFFPGTFLPDAILHVVEQRTPTQTIKKYDATEFSDSGIYGNY